MAMIAMKEQFFTPEQVADALQVSIDTIMRLIKARKLKASQVGSQWRIGETALEQYLEEQSNIQEADQK
jgi:excisionase family DNA binding protein